MFKFFLNVKPIYILFFVLFYFFSSIHSSALANEKLKANKDIVLKLSDKEKKKLLAEIEKNESIETQPTNVTEAKNLESAVSVQAAVRNIAKFVMPSVVNIKSDRLVSDSQGSLFDFFNPYGLPKKHHQERLHVVSGSGFIISPSGYIITNNHVVAESSKIVIGFENSKEYVAKIVGQDERLDIALLKIEPEKNDELPHVRLGNSDDVQIGDFAIAIGSPFGLRGSFTLGVTSAKGRDNLEKDDSASLKNYIQIDTYLHQGNSGGPLLNIKGEVIGVNTAIYSTRSGTNLGIGFAIPINIVKKILPDLIEKGYVETGWLGIGIKPLPKELLEDLLSELPVKGGVLIGKVYTYSPADQAGLKSGDIIIEADGKKIESTSQLTRIVALHSKGDKIKI